MGISKPRPRRQGPSLRFHCNGQYTIRIKRKDYYLGTDIEDAQRRRFEILALVAKGELPPTVVKKSPPVASEQLTVAELIEAYLDTEYRNPNKSNWVDKNGELAGHAKNVAVGLRADLLALHGSSPAAEFRKSDLIKIRDSLIKQGLAQSTIRRRIGTIKGVWFWAAERDIVPEATGGAFLMMRKNTVSNAKPAKQVVNVDGELVAATLPHLPSHFQSIVKLLLLTGARAGELLKAKRRDLDQSIGEIWVLDVPEHKNAWRGEIRRLYLDRAAQEILRPFIPLNPDGYIFSPERCIDNYRREMRSQRRSPLTPSQIERDRRNRENPKRKHSAYFDTRTLGRAISRVCQTAGVARWHLHQLRHTAATNFDRQHGEKIAQALLGHKSGRMTSHYVHSGEEAVLEALTKAKRSG